MELLAYYPSYRSPGVMYSKRPCDLLVLQLDKCAALQLSLYWLLLFEHVIFCRKKGHFCLGHAIGRFFFLF